MVKVKEDLVGKTFTRLTVIEQVEDRIQPSGQRKAQYLCECSCADKKQLVVLADNLKSGNTTSCGCLQKEHTSKAKKKHGDSGRNRLYTTWANMKARCFNKNSDDYSQYGGRGITVCKEWKNSYTSFKNWAINNGYSEVLTLDRIDVNKNYEPNNCRWVDMILQENNRTNNHILEYNGKSHTIQEWSRITGINSSTIHTRISRGWTTERTLTTFVGGDIKWTTD